MDLKIRILSFQNAQNYGAILQAFGLQQVIKDLGFKDVLFINYNPDYLSSRYILFPANWYKPKSKGIRNLISFYINLPFLLMNRGVRNLMFNKSRKNLIEQTKEQYVCQNDIVDVPCDYLVLGSDQIWSTWITGGPDPVFFGKGNYSGLKKTISYAPSSEMSTFNSTNNLKLISELLNGIDCISVREKTVCKMLEEKLGITSKVCVDPTILCGKASYDRIATKRKIKKDYILVYSYNNYSDLIQGLIRSIPEYSQYEIHYIGFTPSGARSTFDSRCHNEISVEEFVSLFKYASYVVTNSFHGLAFSLLFNRKFSVAYEEGKSTRCESLLLQLNALDKLVHDAGEMNWDNFDYDEINEKMETIREESRQFLINSLGV
jgi:putative sterol carrier protein